MRMRIPQVTGRIRADGAPGGPTQALRAVFTQVGRLLLAADRLRRRTPDDPAPRVAAPPRWRPLDQTGNVRLLSPGDLADETPAPPAAADLPVPTAAADLPVPNYDALSVASLRARLRTLDAGQVRALADYERSHAGRPDVVAMFERRIAKLTGP
jgi:hypothetical protein